MPKPLRFVPQCDLGLEEKEIDFYGASFEYVFVLSLSFCHNDIQTSN